MPRLHHMCGIVLSLLILAWSASAPGVGPPLPAEGDGSVELTSDFAPADLEAVPVPPAVRDGLTLRRDTLAALKHMIAAAAEDGLRLRVLSGYRSYERQRVLYESATRRHGKDQRWVAPPGRSEHQLGTAVDFADAELKHVLEESFAGTAEAEWLREHGARFGFVESYTADNAQRTGVEPEPWHWRFAPPESSDGEDDAGEVDGPKAEDQHEAP